MSKPRPTYANLTATLALFLALGGTSYAALQVTGSNVKNGTLTGSDIKNESLKSGDVDNGSLLAKDFKSGQLPAGPAGPEGPQGPQGLQGLEGPQGPAGATNVITRRVNAAVASGGNENRQVNCQAGETVVGGGAGITGAFTLDAAIFTNEPREADGTEPEAGEVATGWGAVGVNGTAVPQIMNVHVLCASP